MPRFVFTDLPLGNPIGPSGDSAQQLRVLRTALDVAQSARFPRTTVQADVTWPGDPDWRNTFMPLDDPEDLRRQGDERRARQAAARAQRRDQSPS